MSGTKSKAKPSENIHGTDEVPVPTGNNAKQNVIMRALKDYDGPKNSSGLPLGFTKAAAVLIYGTTYRVNIFAKNGDDITGRIVFSKVYDSTVTPAVGA